MITTMIQTDHDNEFIVLRPYRVEVDVRFFLVWICTFPLFQVSTPLKINIYNNKKAIQLFLFYYLVDMGSIIIFFVI